MLQQAAKSAPLLNAAAMLCNQEKMKNKCRPERTLIEKSLCLRLKSF
jgi:hypothetical protein